MVKEEPLDGKAIALLAHSIMNERQRENFARRPEMNLGLEVEGEGRFRVNIFRERGEVAMVIRYLTDNIPRCPPWRAKRRRVVPGSREATRDTRRAEGAKGDPKGASERGVQSYGRPVCSRNELAMLWRNAG